ncbi:MAG: CDP-alcohol phosphatidyltransferase family protein [Myxococcota bacterium]
MPPLKFFVPNGFTALSLLLGLASVVMSSQGQFELAAWMVLWGTLLDKADGSAARFLGATSAFGMEFDSFADFVAFGVAPAALVYFRLHATGDYVGSAHIALMLVCGLYVVALAMRLARFNITPGSATHFSGIPGTLVGAVVASGYLTWEAYALDPALLDYSPAYLLIFAALMLSSVRLPKLRARRNRFLNALQFGNVAAAYVFGPLMIFPQYLFGLGVAYLSVGIASGLLSPPSAPEAEDVAAAAEDEEPEQLAT